MAFVPDVAPETKSRFVPDSQPEADPPSKARVAFEKVSQFLRDLPGMGVVNQAATGLANVGGTITAGLTGLGSLATDPLTLLAPDLALQQASERTQKVRDALHVDAAPSGDVLLKGMEKGVGALGKVTAPIDRAIENAGPGVSTFVPAAADFVDQVSQVLPFGAKGMQSAIRTAANPTQAAREAVGAANASVAPGSAEAARAAGIKLRPSDVKMNDVTASPRGMTAERVGGSQIMRQETSMANQPTVQRLANKALGLDESVAKLEPDVLAENRKAAFAVYDKVKALPDNPSGTAYVDSIRGISDEGATPAVKETIASLKKDFGRNASSADLVEWMKSNRADATRRFMSEDADQIRIARANREFAKAAEQELERRAAGQPGLIDEFRGAREHLAKSYVVEEASKKGGYLDANEIARVEKNDPGLLTGELKIIADVANHFPEAVRHPQTFKNAPGGQPVQGTLFGTIKHNTVGAVGRKIAGSDFVQNKFGRVAENQGPLGPLSRYFPDKKQGMAAVLREEPANLAAYPNGVYPARASSTKAGPSGPMIPPEAPDLSQYPVGRGSGPSGTKAGPSGPMIPEAPNLAAYPGGVRAGGPSGVRTGPSGPMIPAEAPNLAAYPGGVRAGGPSGVRSGPADISNSPVPMQFDAHGMPIETLEQRRLRLLAESLRN